MNSEPLVSIIIPTFNRAHLIGETLDSVLAQTYSNWECVVVDDGSTDETEALLHSYMEKDKRFQYHNLPDSHLPGGNGARNFGFRMSQGEYINWFDSDDIMLPKKLELKIEAFTKHDVDFVVCENAEIYSINPYKTKMRWPIKIEGDVLLNHLKGTIAFTTAGPLFKAIYLKNKDLFDEQVLISQEWEFYTRILTTNPKIYYINTILYHFRNVSEGIRGNVSKSKILNRVQTELRLFKYINRTRYFKNSVYLEAYNRYKFFLVLNKFKYLRKNFPIRVSVAYFIIGLRTIHISYYCKFLKKMILKPTIANVLFKGWSKN